MTIASIACAGVTCVQGHDGDHEGAPPKVSDEDRHVATLMPDRIVLTWSGDPAYTQDVTWRTLPAVARGYVEYAVVTAGPYFASNAIRVDAMTSVFDSGAGVVHMHTAKMRALAPSTKYAYRVGDGSNWSEWFHFTTASADSAPFEFVYFGDAQNDIRSLWSRILREAHTDAPKAAFLLHAGDLVNRGNRDSEWGDWFAAGGWVNAMIPSLATPGNHEYEKQQVEGGEPVRMLSKHWGPTFSFPQHGPDGLQESVYFIDYQGVRIISLNSNEQQLQQVGWLKQVLESNPNRWTIVTFHHPIYSSAAGRDNSELRKLWKPLFDEFKVDLVLQGHDHSYARTRLDLPEENENLEFGVNTKQGPTVYVVSVSGPKQYDVGDREFFERTASGAQLYQIIRIDGDQLNYESRVASGQLYDAFTLSKRAGQFNELVNRVPATAEARKPMTIRTASGTQ